MVVVNNLLLIGIQASLGSFQNAFFLLFLFNIRNKTFIGSDSLHRLLDDLDLFKKLQLAEAPYLWGRQIPFEAAHGISSPAYRIPGYNFPFAG